MSVWKKNDSSLRGTSSLASIMQDQEFLMSDLAVAEALHFTPEGGALGSEAPIEYCDADLALAIALQEEYVAALEKTGKISESQGGGNVRVLSQIDLDGDGMNEHYVTEATAQAMADVDEDLVAGDNEVMRTMRVHNQRRVVKGIEVGTRVSAKDTRSTRGAVLDPATELIVFKLIQNGSLQEMESAAVKTGKEASVFHGVLDFSEKSAPWLAHHEVPFAPGTSCAVKIFKTTLNEFSNRAAYFDGDHRFGKFNKAVSTREAIGKWAEKEFRNLIRVNTKSKLYAPKAIAHKEHVVIMTFIGENGVPAPQLKQLPRDGFAAMDWMSMYVDSLTIVYLLLHECHLVHGDLSEYNLLRGPDGNVHVIDFGQAVDTSHPEHFEYLVRDLETVNSFFHRQGVATLPVDELMALCLQPIQEIEELHKLSSDRGDYGDGDSYLDLRNTATSHVEVPYYEEGCRPPPLPAELPGAIRLTPTALDVIRRIIDMKT